MGIAKRMMEEEEGRGYRTNYGKTVCVNCFEEYGLKEFIAEHRTQTQCSYCKGSKKVKACELDLLIGHILVSLRREWGHPADEGLPYESREGGWQFSTVYDTWELLDKIGIENRHGDVYDDICRSILNQEWCERDPYSLSLDQTLLYAWQKFSDFVLNHSRFLFFKVKNRNYDDHQHDEIDPVQILDHLGNIFNNIGLVKEIGSDTSIYRVRIVELDEILSSAKELGSPPNDLATISNRMSPSGIPMFYGAFEIETAIKETYESCEESKKAFVGIFNPVRPLKVIDLADNIYIPSIFDHRNSSKRDHMSFLLDFIADFTKPIDRKDRAHIDYVPTQIVTEYIRHIFECSNGDRIDGVVYPSSKNDGNRAIVIFASSEQCVDVDEPFSENALLKLVGTDSIIVKGA
ncbi:HEPN-associated N-terminal domain-containing protein [Cellvibrio sp. QJXJ]|uniref:HEPN-associated N-terminal domain-containing protein n=1 Tax=Cellvibrio sp. QJXJ TaxID=2964606 RepID=UPI0021C402E1|nr:HEPN-associated N-terminal domain-containing protein [Cellvibrio sp. QJXJ]UUA72614.1 HEPN-associated N-terminal domain-containing protein [Cellvibrio sp. QJXJ]